MPHSITVLLKIDGTTIDDGGNTTCFYSKDEATKSFKSKTKLTGSAVAAKYCSIKVSN